MLWIWHDWHPQYIVLYLRQAVPTRCQPALGKSEYMAAAGIWYDASVCIVNVYGIVLIPVNLKMLRAAVRRGESVYGIFENRIVIQVLLSHHEVEASFFRGSTVAITVSMIFRPVDHFC